MLNFLTNNRIVVRKDYIQAARLRTLPLSISGIVVGSFLAFSKEVFDWRICFFAILTTVGFQVISNFANDYGDGVKGTDANRIGQERLVASGKISSKEMKTAMLLVVIITVILSLITIYFAFGKTNLLYIFLFFSLAIGAIVAAIKYTVGKFAYGYYGFGDIFVFLFFGLTSTLGSYFLYTKTLNFSIFLPATSVGLLSVAVLNLNNMRDSKNDQKMNKNTLVVKMGMTFSKYYHYTLIIASFLFAFLYGIITYQNISGFLFVLAYLPLVKHLLLVAKNKESVLLDKELKKVALSTFLFAILFGLGIALS